jgi:lanosterol synthase
MGMLHASVREVIRHSLNRLVLSQSERGEWEAEVVWSPVILAQYLIVRRIVGKPFPAGACEEYLRYFSKRQTGKGGWGLHPESPDYLFVTTLVYVAMRFLDVPADDKRLVAARALIRKLGTPLLIPTWGKLWLAFCSLYEYKGIYPLFPELWLLPSWLPFHPSRLYCHTRLIYLGMCFLWGKRFSLAPDGLCNALRQELYDAPYESLDFRKAKKRLAYPDCFVVPSGLLKVAYAILTIIEGFVPAVLRRRALASVLARIEYEQRSTQFAALSPVNGLLNILALHAANPNHPDLQPSLLGVEKWKWVDAEEGARYCGARSQTWDTAFVVQAACTAGSEDSFMSNLVRAASYLRANQVEAELSDGQRFFRSARSGGWCFSDVHHGWPVSDTTAEALAAILTLRKRNIETLTPAALESAVRFLLARQNKNGGWSSYERGRGSLLLERINPSEMFANCMVEHSYVECTGSALCALARFREAFPGHSLTKTISTAVGRGERFILRVQEPGGAWPGFWGINYTYGTLFAVRGLLAGDSTAHADAIRRACDWLIGHQKEDGGWGEHWTGVPQGRYIEHPRSQVIQTSWALLVLLLAKDPRRDAIDRGITLLIDRQQAGAWPREGVAGVFFTTAMLHYDLYREYFPLWAMGLYQKIYLNQDSSTDEP